MRLPGLIGVSFDGLDLDACVDAMIAGDADALGAQLDAGVRFTGLGGALVERVDGVVFVEISRLLMTLAGRHLARLGEALAPRD